MATMRVDEIKSMGNVRKDLMIGDLLDSIKQHGIELPLALYRKGGVWYVKEGHRRLACAKKLGMTDVPYTEVPAPADAADAIIEQLVINTDRANLSYLEVAEAYAALINEGWSQAEIARQFNTTPPDVSIALATLRAAPALREAVNSRKLSPSAIEPLLSMSLEDQERLAPAAIAAKTARKIRDVAQADKMRKKQEYESVEDDEADDDTNPLETLLVETIEEAVASLRALQDTKIKHPSLMVRGRRSINELRQMTQRLAQEVA